MTAFLSTASLCLRWIHSNKDHNWAEIPEMIYWWLFKIIKKQHFSVQHAIPLPGVWWDVPATSQSGVIWSNYFSSNLLYTLTLILRHWSLSQLLLSLYFFTYSLHQWKAFTWLSLGLRRTHWQYCACQWCVISICLNSTLVVFLICSFTLSNAHCWSLVS